MQSDAPSETALEPQSDKSAIDSGEMRSGDGCLIDDHNGSEPLSGRAAPGKKKLQQMIPAEERRKYVLRQYVRGVPAHVIAERVKVHPDSIYRDIRKIRKQWEAEAKADIATHVRRELAKLDAIEQEAWRGWERSVKIDTEHQERTREAASGTYKESKKIVKPSAGDPRYLDVIHKCVDRRCRILGVDAPVQAQLGIGAGSSDQVAGIQISFVPSPHRQQQPVVDVTPECRPQRQIPEPEPEPRQRLLNKQRRIPEPDTTIYSDCPQICSSDHINECINGEASS